MGITDCKCSSTIPKPIRTQSVKVAGSIYPDRQADHRDWSTGQEPNVCVLLCFIEPVVWGMGPGASSLRDC
jgi:hypothetical protein